MGFLNIKRSNLKAWSLVLLAVGFLGVVFFFPVDINSRYTCLYHRLTEPVGGGHQHTTALHTHHPEDPEPAATGDLLSNYIRQYAVFWWVSILLLLGGYFLLRLLREENRHLTKKYSD